MEAYTHYGKQADVFKHLVLCEVLKNEMPVVYIDTNSASAVYRLQHTPEQDYGIYYFLQTGSANNKLKKSDYYRLAIEALRKSCYYGSPALAIKILRDCANKYYFFDLESKSLDNIWEFAVQEHLNSRVMIQNCDSTKGVMDLLPTLPKDSFLHIDPYEIDKIGVSGHTYFDIFIQASRLGMKCLLWYGFMTLDDKQRLDKYMDSHLQNSGIQNIIGSELIMNCIRENTVYCNPGILGSGLLATNLSAKSNCQLLNFTRLLVDTYKNSQYKSQDGSLYYELFLR